MRGCCSSVSGATRTKWSTQIIRTGLLTTHFSFVFSFAFVEFDTTDDAKEALENLNNTDIEGRTIRLEYSQQNNRGNDGGRGNSGRTF